MSNKEDESHCRNEVKHSQCWVLAWLVREIKGPSIREQRANCLISLSAWVVLPWEEGGRWKRDKGNKWSSPLGGGFSLRRARGYSGCTAAWFAAAAPVLGCLKMSLEKWWEIPWNKRAGEGQGAGLGRSLLSLLQSSLPPLSSCGFSILILWYYGFHIEKYLADLRDQAKSNTSEIIPEPLGKATGDQLPLLHWHFSPECSILGAILPMWYFLTFYICMSSITIRIVLNPARCSTTTLMQGSNDGNTRAFHQI